MLVVLVVIFPGNSLGIFRWRRISTARVNIELVAGSRRARRARAMDCQIKAQRASSVEMKVEGIVMDDVARAFKTASEADLKVKQAQDKLDGAIDGK